MSYLATCLADGDRELQRALRQTNLISTESGGPTVIFAISLRSRATSHDWQCVEANLARTLRTVKAQSYQRCRVIVCGHERPNIPELNQKCVQWIGVDFDPPSAVVQYHADKKAKRRVIGAALHKEGFEGYFMALDADDWLHRRAAEFFALCFERQTKILNSGFVVNLLHESASLRRREFYYGCGSSAIFYFQRDDFPSNDTLAASKPLRFQLALHDHQKVLDNLARKNERGRLIDIPLLAWVLGTGQNLSLANGEQTGRSYLWSR